MTLLASLLVGAVAAAHLGFLVLEMVFWQKPLGRKVFRLSAADAATTAVLAQNQGLYNGFLAAGLVWGLVLAAQGAPHAAAVQTFFLVCVVVAGAFGAATVSPRIAVVQAAPALAALAAVFASTP